MYYDILQNCDGLPFDWFGSFPLPLMFQTLKTLTERFDGKEIHESFETACGILLIYHSVNLADECFSIFQNFAFPKNIPEDMKNSNIFFHVQSTQYIINQLNFSFCIIDCHRSSNLCSCWFFKYSYYFLLVKLITFKLWNNIIINLYTCMERPSWTRGVHFKFLMYNFPEVGNNARHTISEYSFWQF